jgi:hypothetical protein
MSEQMEGLVEEINERFCELKIKEYIPGQLETTIKWAIARIGKAYAEGMKLPGEAGRAVWLKQGDEDHIYEWVADVIESGARSFIALRPES